MTTNQNSGKASIGWEDSKKRLQASIMTIGEGFRDDIGFVRRTGVTRQFYDWRLVAAAGSRCASAASGSCSRTRACGITTIRTASW